MADVLPPGADIYIAVSILNSPRAAEISIFVVRAFARLRELATWHGDLAKRLAELVHKTEAVAMNHDTFSYNTRAQRKNLFDTLRELMTSPDPPKWSIGFGTPEAKGNKAQAGGKA